MKQMLCENKMLHIFEAFVVREDACCLLGLLRKFIHMEKSYFSNQLSWRPPRFLFTECIARPQALITALAKY